MWLDIAKEMFSLTTKSSATSKTARDADDVDYKFSEVTVHLIKKRH